MRPKVLLLDGVTSALGPELVAGVLDVGPPDQIFNDPQQQRTREFLSTVQHSTVKRDFSAARTSR